MDPLLLFVLLVISSICKGQFDDDVFPKDQYIEEGSSTEVICRSTCFNGRVFWTIDKRPVDESLSETINSTHTVLSLRNFTHHNATVECSCALTHQVVGGTVIRTYSKPRNISCILHYENVDFIGVPELLTCTWEHRLHSPVKINYTLFCASSLHTSWTVNCSSQLTNCTVKDFYNSNKWLQTGKELSVTVRAKTASWEVYSDSHEFHPYHILKIIPPKITVKALPDHLLVEWKRLRTPRQHHCQIKYTKVSSGDERVLEVCNKTLHADKYVRIRIEEDLESCTEYSLSGRCALDKAPWSDWSQEKTVLTKLNKSLIRLWRKVTDAGKNGVRKVHAMWTDIPSACEGTFNHTIKQTSYKEDTPEGNYTCTPRSNSTCDVDVNQAAHRINLTVFHNEVLLAEDSVYVPATEESLPEVTDIQASSHDGAILVNWRPPDQPVSGYMIDWTHNGNQYYWKESKYANATLFDLLDKKAYNITVTPLFGEKTGHGTQALQICSRIGEPSVVVITNVQAYDKSVNVSWDIKTQDACSGDVLSFTVFYGKQEEPPLNVTVDSKRKNVFLKDLTTDTQYSVYVEAAAHTGTTRSEERLFKTKLFDPNLITELTVGGSLIIVLVLSLGLCCAIQWKKFKEKPVPNPGLSSVVLWPSPNHQKGICLFQPFSNPSESPCDKVYTEETTSSSTPSLAIGPNGTTDCDQSDEYADSALVRDESLTEQAETQHPSPSEESTAFLLSESSPVNPYRSQTSVGSPVAKSGNPCNGAPAKQQEKTQLKTVYVTLDMFEHGQGH